MNYKKLIDAGNKLEDEGFLDEAILCYKNAIQLNPSGSSGYLNLGNVLLLLRRYSEAVTAYSTAIQCDNSYAAAHYNLGNAYLFLANHQAAIASYQKAIELKPNFTAAEYALDCLADDLDESDDSEAQYRRGLEKTVADQPLSANARWSLAMAQVWPIYENPVDFEQARLNFERELDKLNDWFSSDRLSQGAKAVGTTQPFHLAYHEFNVQPLLLKYGRLCCRIMVGGPQPQLPLKQKYLVNRKYRIGIVSAQIHNHSVWLAISRGWILNLDRSRFELHVFHLGNQNDEATAHARLAAEYFVELPRTMIEWSQSIVDSHIDVLLYPEIGMDTLTTQLACQRLAPVQVASWGHPITTGLPTIDYFLSAELFEPDNANTHYSEKLVCLPNLGVCIQPLAPEVQPLNHKAHGLPENEPLILCPGMPFKYNPKHDEIWAALALRLQHLGRGRLIFFKSQYRAMNHQFERRLRRHFRSHNIEFDGTVQFIEQLPRDQFYALMQESTLMLDTIGFSGFNTAMQSLECNLPIVAFEGKFMRGRLCSAILRRIGLDPWVATTTNEFIEKTMQIISDSSVQNKLREQIACKSRILFNDLQPIRALEEFLFEVVEEI